MAHRLFILFFILTAFVTESQSQQYVLSGKLTNKRQEALPFASVYIKELAQGTMTDEAGIYSFRLEPGKYDIVISMIGFKPQIITITMKEDYKLNVLMEEDYGQTLSEVQIFAAKKDISEEIVKNVIRNKEKHIDASASYTAQLYIRATAEREPVKKKINDSSTVLVNDLASMSMAEVTLKADHAAPDKIKEVRTGIKVRGKTENLFYLTTTDGDFNFYKNLVQLPALSKMPMLSPVSNSGLIAYKYKTTSIRKEKGRTFYTIKVTPGRLGNALVSGEMEIMDSAWVLTYSRFELPKYHMDEFDFFSVEQQYEWVNKKAWMPVRQDFTYTIKQPAGKINGKTLVVYSDYNVDTTFSKKNFTVELSSTKLEAYDRDSVFWDIVRKEPLTNEEIKFVHYRDSISLLQSSARYKDSLDRETNKITLLKLFLSAVENNNWRKERNLYLGTIPQLYKPFQFGGSRIGHSLFLHKNYPNRKNVFLHVGWSIGLRNKDLQGEVNFRKRYDPFRNGSYTVNMGRDFAQIFDGDAWVNHLKRSNVYLRDRLAVFHSIELANGLMLQNGIELAYRQSVAHYKTTGKLDSLIGSTGPDNRPIDFDPYLNLYSDITLSFTPQQKYIREPREKIILGSKWPTFSVTWRKGIPKIFNSKTDFDYVEYSIKQKIKMGLLGDLNYSLISGRFVTMNDLRLVDYKYMRKGDPVHFMNPSLSFQSLDSSFPIFKRYLEGHFMHQFYGAVLNKIPLLKKLQLREVIGGGILYAPERNLKYLEGYVGIEKVFRLWKERYKIGGFLVSSVANTFNNPIQLRFAFQKFNRKTNKWLW